MNDDADTVDALTGQLDRPRYPGITMLRARSEDLLPAACAGLGIEVRADR